jgi:hypothetical protein
MRSEPPTQALCQLGQPRTHARHTRSLFPGAILQTIAPFAQS